MPQKKSNPYLNYKVTIYRVVIKKTRYYSIEILPTLFGEYLLVKEFGGVKNKKPTRIIKEYFSHLEDSIIALEDFIGVKMKKGYFI